MNLLQLRNEVLAHGFDQTQYGARINNYLNDAYQLACRRVDYYVDENTYPFQTASGTAMYPWPADFGRGRSLYDSDRDIEMEYVSLRDIDRSIRANAAPTFYALDGQNIHLYPTPDAVYNLVLRYWKMPALLVQDTDTPTLPADWHRMLCEYAIGRCYWGDDDAQMGQQWEQKFNTTLAEFAADVKFPDTDGPSQASGMWEGERSLSGPGWTLWSGWE